MGRAADLLLPAHVLAPLGLLLELGGGTWDVASHILRGGRGTENFWTPPHALLYAGVALVALASGLILVARLAPPPLVPPPYLTAGLTLVAGGASLQLFSGAFDQWWHATFGLDVVLFSPPHALLIVAMAVNALGVVVGTLRLRGAGPLVARHPRLLTALGLLALVGLFSALDGLVYLFTDLRGFEYTFHLAEGTLTANSALRDAVTLVAILLLALLGTLVLLTARRALGGPGYATLVALGLAALMAAAALAPLALAPATFEGRREAWTIPAYFAFVIPVALLDRWGLGAERGARRWAAATLLAPFAFALDGWYSTALLPTLVADPLGPWTLALAATLPMGPLALLLSRRLTGFLGRGPAGLGLPTAR